MSAKWWALLVFVIGLMPVSRETFAQESASQECVSVTSRKSVRIQYAAGDAVLIERSDAGVLRALDAATSSELWQFAAPEIATSTIHSGLMTDLTVLRFDSNDDGVIDKTAGDRVWVYFGLKRAGPFYYAIDVTDRTPRVLWRRDGEALAGLGDAWSTPALTRVRIAGAMQNGERFVVILGGGLGGARLFMLDAATGRRLWSAGPGASADRVLPRMTEGIAARVTVIDFDGDEYADRVYAADVGGRIWRFDIWNGHDEANLVTGGIFAQLSAATPGDARRFFNAPDVSLIRSREGRMFLNIAIGSGDATDASSVAIHDRFYALRDYEPFVKRSQATYDAAVPLADADLTGGSAGWKLDLRTSGEKVLADSLTVDGAVMFTTYEPPESADPSGCEQNGTNRVYYVWIDDAAAVMDLNDDEKVTDEDRSAPLTQRGIADGPRIERLPDRTTADPSTPPSPSGPDNPEPGTGARCLAGAEVLKHCLPLGTVLRTYWKRTSIN